MECLNNKNKTRCTCTYEPCSRKGRCCECIDYHKKMGELPGCLFSPKDERTYDRSVEFFVKCHKSDRVS